MNDYDRDMAERIDKLEDQIRMLESHRELGEKMIGEYAIIFPTESIMMEDGLYHDVLAGDYSVHSPKCKYCDQRKKGVIAK